MKKVFVVSYDNIWHISIDNYYVKPIKNKNTGFLLNTYHDKMGREITLAYFKDINSISQVLNALDNNVEMNFTTTISENEFLEYINKEETEVDSSTDSDGESK